MDVTTKTDISGVEIVDRRHWSYSGLEKFTQCPRRFHAYEIAKLVSEPQNPQMMEGHRVHKAMAEFVSKGTPLPPDMAGYVRWFQQLFTCNADETVLVEQRFACTFELEPCEYFSRTKKVWLRTVADIIVINGDKCKSWDWKTGREKDPKYELLPEHFQLKLVALTIFLNYPKINTIDSAYVYLTEGFKTEFSMRREELRTFIPQMYDIAGGLQRAVRTNQFPPRSSGLCKRHCAVTSCEFYGKGAH